MLDSKFSWYVKVLHAVQEKKIAGCSVLKAILPIVIHNTFSFIANLRNPVNSDLFYNCSEEPIENLLILLKFIES